MSNLIHGFNIEFEKCTYAVYVYQFSYILEVILSEMTDTGYLCKVRDEIQSKVDKLKSGLSWLNTIIFRNQNDDGIFSRDYFIDTDYSSLGLAAISASAAVFGSVLHIGKLVYDTNKAFKEKQKAQETEKLINSVQKSMQRKCSSADERVKVIDSLDRIYNKHSTLLVTKDAAYIQSNG